MKQNVKVDLDTLELINYCYMLNSEEVITRSKQITELGVEIQKAYAMQFEYRAKAEEAEEIAKKLTTERAELVNSLIKDCNESVTIDDLD